MYSVFSIFACVNNTSRALYSDDALQRRGCTTVLGTVVLSIGKPPHVSVFSDILPELSRNARQLKGADVVHCIRKPIL